MYLLATEVRFSRKTIASLVRKIPLWTERRWPNLENWTRSPTAEAQVLGTCQCGFESHRVHSADDLLLNTTRGHSMNIFILDECPKRAAQFLCDKHVPKMLLESVQILSTVLWNHKVTAPYRETHKNHPCTLWANESRANYAWLYDHACAIDAEYLFRFKKVHKSGNVLTEDVFTIPLTQEKFFPREELTPFAQAMPPEYKDPGNPVIAYRDYYIYEKYHFAKWCKRRPKPHWWPY